MKSFTVKITLRIYDTELITNLDDKYQKLCDRYESKNQFLTNLIRLGLETLDEQEINKQKSHLTKQTIPKEYQESIKQIQSLFEDIHLSNKQQVEVLLAHLSISEKMSAAIYHMLLALIEDGAISKYQVEEGFYDDLPERMIKELQQLVNKMNVRKAK